MTRFVVDCGVVLHLASEGIEVPAEHELLAPTLLRSQTLSAMHEAGFAEVSAGLFEEGVAKEVARMALPLSLYTKYFWSCNPRSLMHFCSLRNHEAAQYEIRQYAAAKLTAQLADGVAVQADVSVSADVTSALLP